MTAISKLHSCMCVVVCTVRCMQLETCQVCCILIKNMWHVIRMKTWLLSLHHHPLFWVYVLYIAYELARARTLEMQNRNAISTCGSQSFVLSNLFLWQNRKRELHSISQHFHKFAIKTKFNELCSFLALLLTASISNGSSTNKNRYFV